MSATEKPRADTSIDPKLKSRNKWAFILDGASFNVGAAFLEGNTVLPTFASTLTSSPFIIGLVSSIRTFGYLVPQIFVAGLIENRPMKKPFMMKSAYVMRLAGTAMALSVLMAKQDPGWALAMFFASLTVFAFADGFASLPWMELVARTIPQDRRSRLFGTMQALGGVGSFAAGFLIQRLLGQDGNYPFNYFTVMALGIFFQWCSLVSCHFIVDPGGPAPARHSSLGTYLKRLPSAWAENPLFRKLMVTRLLTGSFYLCLPFYAIHAQRELNFPVSVLGLFVSAQMVGNVMGGPVWGYLGDHKGPHWVIRIVAVITVAAPLLALGARLTVSWGSSAIAYVLYLLLYFCIGAFFGGTWIGFSNYVFDISVEGNRATLVGLYNTVGAPITLLSVLGGWVLQVSNYPALFAIVAAIEVMACVVAFRLPNPREAPPVSPSHTL